jgi:hypothetical protein
VKPRCIPHPDGDFERLLPIPPPLNGYKEREQVKKIQHFLKQIEFHVFLACLGLLVISWPFLATSNQQQPEKMFVYLFLPWGIIIVILVMMSRSYDTTSGAPAAATSDATLDNPAAATSEATGAPADATSDATLDNPAAATSEATGDPTDATSGTTEEHAP